MVEKEFYDVFDTNKNDRLCVDFVGGNGIIYFGDTQ